jgi:hypothetical protein
MVEKIELKDAIDEVDESIQVLVKAWTIRKRDSPNSKAIYFNNLLVFL